MDVINLVIGSGLTTFIIVLAVAFILLFGWLMMLVDCAKRKFDKKLLWLILLILFNLISAWFYYFFVKRKGSGEAALSEKKESSTVRIEIKNAGEPVKEEKPAKFMQLQSHEENEEDGKTLEELQNMSSNK